MPSSDPASQPYGFADRLLHRVALSRPVMEMSFDLERARFGKAARSRGVTEPVFVCGLARAGTTIVMRLLHDGGSFASLSYRDLPFPLAPNSWARLGAGLRRDVAARERGHGDGLLHDLDSPEAIEEVFWRCFEGPNFLRPEGLVAADPAPETLDGFADYVALVMLRHRGARYLSKNNNNILRLAGLVETFADAVLIHPFRAPVQQAMSLLAQHRRACALAAGDPFRREFMGLLGHHEFGAGHRPFALGETRGRSDAGGPDYWLAQWIAVYRHLLDAPPQVRARQSFLDYDALVAEPANGVAALARIAGVADLGAAGASRLTAPKRHAADHFDPELFAAATHLHDELKSRTST